MEATQLRFLTSSSLEHDHIACKGDSAWSWQRSQVELVIIVRRNRFSIVGRELRHALYMWFLILLGVCKDHNPFHSWVSWDDGVLCDTSSIEFVFCFNTRYGDAPDDVGLLGNKESIQQVIVLLSCLSIQQNINSGCAHRNNNRWGDHGWMFNRQPPVTPYLNGFSITNTPPCSP